MKPNKTFLEDEEGKPISRTAFRKMRKAQKRELMLRWFGQNFEDPAQHTSYISAEGGYLWNHGGPYDAKDELFGMFGDIVPEALIDEVATEVQDENGIYEWAGTAHHEQEYEDYDDDDDRPRSVPSPFDSFGEQPTALYGSKRDYEERERVRSSLRGLLQALDAEKPVGIGHNNPPTDIEQAVEVEEIRSAAIKLQSEFKKVAPSIAAVKRIGSAFYRAAGASIKWVGGKLNRIVDKTIDTAVPATVAAVGLAYHDHLLNALEAILRWLAIVAQKIF